MTAVPALSKAYEISVNNVVPTQAELAFHQEMLFGIKEAMINFATLPWTVIASSDSLVADANDNWNVQADLVWATGAHSWIVLQRGAGGGQFLIDLDYSSTQPEKAQTRWSPSAGFTGGTTTVMPTATDEIDISTFNGISDEWSGNNSPTPPQNVWHFWHSTDGLVDRLAICHAGKAHSFWFFDEIKNPRTAHTNNPTAVGIAAQLSPTAAEFTSGSLRSAGTSSLLVTEKDGTGTRYRLGMLMLGGSGSSSQPLMDDVSDTNVVEEWDNQTYADELHLFNIDTGSRGPKGSLYDCWFAQHQIASTGDTMPGSPTVREFVVMGPFVMPWTNDATIPQVS